MKAVILAAGYATRLHPYTRFYPKTLLRVGGRPLLDATVKALEAAPEIDGLVLVTNSRFAALFERWRLGFESRRPVTVLDDGTASNETRRGSIGDLVFAMDRLALDEDLLVVSSDKLFEFSISAFVRSALDRGGGANTCADAGDPALLAGRRGCAVLSADGRITEFLEKPARPPSSIESLAFYVFPRSLLPLIREYARATSRPDAPGTMMEWLVRRAPVYAWMIDGECLDVGDPASYREADRIAWEKQGKKAPPVEVLLDGRSMSETALGPALEAALGRLEGDADVVMAHLAVTAAAEAPMESWVTAHPHLLPVDVLQSPLPPAGLARARGCSRIIALG